MLTEFVDQLSVEAGAPQPTSAATFLTLEDFNEGSTGALKWKDMAQDRVYRLNHQNIIQLLLYGDTSFSDAILIATLKFLKDCERFL